MTDMGVSRYARRESEGRIPLVISSSEWNQDLMQMDVQIDIVMADLDNDPSMFTTQFQSWWLLQMEYTHVQVGEVVNHLLWRNDGSRRGNNRLLSNSRCNSRCFEVIAEQGGLFNEGGLFNDGGDDDDDDDGDLPEDAVITIIWIYGNPDNDNGVYGGWSRDYYDHSHRPESRPMSMSMETENAYDLINNLRSDVRCNSHRGDETLPKNSIPVWLDFAGEDEFVVDQGRQSHGLVDDGYPIVKMVQTNLTITETK